MVERSPQEQALIQKYGPNAQVKVGRPPGTDTTLEQAYAARDLFCEGKEVEDPVKVVAELAHMLHRAGSLLVEDQHLLQGPQ